MRDQVLKYWQNKKNNITYEDETFPLDRFITLTKQDKHNLSGVLGRPETYMVSI